MTYWLWRCWRLVIVVFDSATLRVTISVAPHLTPTDPRVNAVVYYRNHPVPLVINRPFYLYRPSDYTLSYLFRDLEKLGLKVPAVQVRVGKTYRLHRRTTRINKLIERLG